MDRFAMFRAHHTRDAFRTPNAERGKIRVSLRENLTVTSHRGARRPEPVGSSTVIL
jgi:hypothetical protein